MNDTLQTIATFIGLPLVGSIVGSVVSPYLGQYFFPYQLKRKLWLWEKEKEANELFIDRLFKLHFIGLHDLNNTYLDDFSMYSEGNASGEMISLVKTIHKSNAIGIYLKKKDKQVFSDFLKESQEILNDHKKDHGQWPADDYDAVEKHNNELISALTNLSNESLESLGFNL